jgi:hypothetical protein
MLACEPQGRTIPNYLVMDLEAYICSNNAEMIERERRDE